MVVALASAIQLPIGSYRFFIFPEFLKLSFWCAPTAVQAADNALH